MRFLVIPGLHYPMSSLASIDGQLLEIFQNEKALEALKVGLSRQGLTIYSVGSVLQGRRGPDSQVRHILNCIREAEGILQQPEWVKLRN